MEELIITSPCFEEGGLIPVEHTGHGEDRSPELRLNGLREEAVSLAVVMDDMGHPIPSYNHWIIWNIPAAAVVPGGIPAGEYVSELGNAVQGRGYGRHRYRGPKPPFGWSHVYRYHVFALDCYLDLPPRTRKKALLSAMQGHILQQGALRGHYR